MFSRKKDSMDVSDEKPVFHVRYVGATETFVSSGKGCTTAPLQRLWDNAPSEKQLHKVSIQLSLAGICMKGVVISDGTGTSFVSKQEDGGKVTKETLVNMPGLTGVVATSGSTSTLNSKNEDSDTDVTYFAIEDISFCSADGSVHERLFCWIYKQPFSGRLELHAVICSTRDKAHTMTTVLSRAFRLAYKDWRAERQREERRRMTYSKSLAQSDRVLSSGSRRNVYGSESRTNGSSSKKVVNENEEGSLVNTSIETSQARQPRQNGGRRTIDVQVENRSFSEPD